MMYAISTLLLYATVCCINSATSWHAYDCVPHAVRLLNLLMWSMGTWKVFTDLHCLSYVLLPNQSCFMRIS